LAARRSGTPTIPLTDASALLTDASGLFTAQHAVGH